MKKMPIQPPEPTTARAVVGRPRVRLLKSISNPLAVAAQL